MYMLHLLLTLFVLSSPADTSILFDFQTGCDMNAWYIVNDGVMGGLSEGALELTSEGHGSFTGQVRL